MSNVLTVVVIFQMISLYIICQIYISRYLIVQRLREQKRWVGPEGWFRVCVLGCSERVNNSGVMGGLPRHPMLGWNSVGFRWGRVERDRRDRIVQ